MRLVVGKKKTVNVSVVNSCRFSLLSTVSTFWHQQSIFFFFFFFDRAIPSLFLSHGSWVEPHSGLQEWSKVRVIGLEHRLGDPILNNGVGPGILPDY